MMPWLVLCLCYGRMSRSSLPPRRKERIFLAFSMQLDKQTITVMKGYAILFIALHNFLHKKSLAGFVQENENTFDVSRTWDYLNTFRKKLMLLLLPAASFFTIYFVMKGTWGVIPKTVLQLSLLYNFTMPALTIYPGVFWYFGLTFELYVLYFLLRKFLRFTFYEDCCNWRCGLHRLAYRS